MKPYSPEARIAALNWQSKGCPAPAPITRRARIAALSPAQRANFLTTISKIHLVPGPARRKAIDQALLQTEWDSGIITPAILLTHLSLKIVKGETSFYLKIEQGTLQMGIDGDVVRIRWFKGRISKSSLVLARHIGGEWKIEAADTDLIKFIREIEQPPIKTEPWKPDVNSRRGRVGSLPGTWSV